MNIDTEIIDQYRKQFNEYKLQYIAHRNTKTAFYVVNRDWTNEQINTIIKLICFYSISLFKTDFIGQKIIYKVDDEERWKSVYETCFDFYCKLQNINESSKLSTTINKKYIYDIHNIKCEDKDKDKDKDKDATSDKVSNGQNSTNCHIEDSYTMLKTESKDYADIDMDDFEIQVQPNENKNQYYCIFTPKKKIHHVAPMVHEIKTNSATVKIKDRTGSSITLVCEYFGPDYLYI